MAPMAPQPLPYVCIPINFQLPVLMILAWGFSLTPNFFLALYTHASWKCWGVKPISLPLADGSWWISTQLTHRSGRLTLRSVPCVVYRRSFCGFSSSYSRCRSLFDNVPFIDSLAVPVSLLRFLANISWGQLHNKWLVLKKSSWHLLLGECKLRQLVWAVIWGNRSLRWILEPHQMAINKSHHWWLLVWW